MRRAIVFGVHPWSGPFQLGAHHFARALARADFDVLYVAPPLSPPHVAAALLPRMRTRWSEYFSPPAAPGVRVITPFTLTPLSARWGAGNDEALVRWPRTTWPSLARTFERMGFTEPDLALLDGPLQLAAARLARPRRLVLRVFDRFTQMPGMTPALLRLAHEAAREADITICSAHALEAEAKALGASRVRVSPNGVDAAHFAAPRPEPVAYRAIARPRAVYVGQTGPLFDQRLLARVAVERPHVSFVLIGPSGDLASLAGIANVHRLGPVEWSELPAFLQHADVGLIPFAADPHRDYVEGVNPLKLYEYMASGIPVVSTRWTELERIGAPGLALAEAQGFGAALDRTLAAPTPSDPLRAFAAASDWDQRLRAVLNALD